MKYTGFFLILLFIESSIQRFSSGNMIYFSFVIIFFLSRMTLIGMFGKYINKTTTSSEMIEALNKLKIPRSVGIPFSVLLRFAPTMKYEMDALKENLIIRGAIRSKGYALIHPIKYAEFTLVPLLMRAIKISDELSASALIRGLDSEEDRVSIVDLKFSVIDLVVVIIGIIISIIVLILQNKM